MMFLAGTSVYLSNCSVHTSLHPCLASTLLSEQLLVSSTCSNRYVV